jgi:hypothetical protein
MIGSADRMKMPEKITSKVLVSITVNSDFTLTENMAYKIDRKFTDFMNEFKDFLEKHEKIISEIELTDGSNCTNNE